jgi:hypothetical protein
MGFENSSPMPLPDALRGESWAFVALPLAGVKEEAEQVKSGRVFGVGPDGQCLPHHPLYSRTSFLE